MFDPVIYFFILGVFARGIGSDLSIPKCMYETLTIYFLLAIGLMGGVELHEWLTVDLLVKSVVIMLFGIVCARVVLQLLRFMSSYSDEDAKIVAAHYGSVSIGTYAVAVSMLQGYGISYEPYMPLFVALLEFPAIVYAVLLLRKTAKCTKSLGRIIVECFEEKSVLLLLGSILIGFVIGKQGMVSLSALFVAPFKGMLALFLMEMGLLVGERFADLKNDWVRIAGLSILISLTCGLLGLIVAMLLGLSVGGTILLMTLGASASYVAVPAVIRSSFPSANVALGLTHSLGMTFTFNVLFGIYLYKWIVTLLLHA